MAEALSKNKFLRNSDYYLVPDACSQIQVSAIYFHNGFTRPSKFQYLKNLLFNNLFDDKLPCLLNIIDFTFYCLRYANF